MEHHVLNPSSNTTPAYSAKPTHAWISERLTTLANLRRTKTPEALDAFASALTGFGQEAIHRACERIETTEPNQGEPAFPRLGKLLEECRREASTHHMRGDVRVWSVEDYRMCRDFDRFIEEEMDLHKKTVAQVLTRFPGMARRWLAWKKQREEGTLVCPHWCETCEGVGWVVGNTTTIEGTEEHVANRCPTCKR